MIKKVLDNKVFFIIMHIILGFVATFPLISTVYSTVTISVFISILILNKNKNEEASIFAAYIIGAEVFLRMTKGYILYETGKYAVILFLLLGIFLGKFKQHFSIQFTFYILLLLLGIVFTEVPEGESIRKSIVFNLSGPIVLGVASIYFYKRPIEKKEIFEILFFMLLPLFSIISYLYFRTPNLEEIVFGTAANNQKADDAFDSIYKPRSYEDLKAEKENQPFKELKTNKGYQWNSGIIKDVSPAGFCLAFEISPSQHV